MANHLAACTAMMLSPEYGKLFRAIHALVGGRIRNPYWGIIILYNSFLIQVFSLYGDILISCK